MCDLNGPFKFCTCSGKIDKTKPYWVLNKSSRKEDLPESDIIVMGTFIRGEDEDEIGINPEVILIKLNSENIFDFKYSSNENDILKVFDGKFTHHFIYSKCGKTFTWEVLGNEFYNNEKSKFILTPKKKGFIQMTGI